MGRKRHNVPGSLPVPVAVIIWQEEAASSAVCFLCYQAVVLASRWHEPHGNLSL